MSAHSISREMFTNPKTLPAEIACMLDKDWQWVYAEHVAHGKPSILALCRRCNATEAGGYRAGYRLVDITVIKMLKYLFVVDDMEDYYVYYGICSACGTPHWASTGASFGTVRKVLCLGGERDV